MLGVAEEACMITLLKVDEAIEVRQNCSMWRDLVCHPNEQNSRLSIKQNLGNM